MRLFGLLLCLTCAVVILHNFLFDPSTPTSSDSESSHRSEVADGGAENGAVLFRSRDEAASTSNTSERSGDSKLPPAASTDERIVARSHQNAETASDVELGGTEVVGSVLQAKLAELEVLSRNSDSASMEAILSEIKSPHLAVRTEALEAIIQFGSRDAIPALKELAAKTSDPHEKVAILEAVEYLELPTLGELRTDLRERALQKAGSKPGN